MDEKAPDLWFEIVMDFCKICAGVLVCMARTVCRAYVGSFDENYGEPHSSHNVWKFAVVL